MSASLRAALIGALAAVTLGAAVQSAAALTVSPSGSYAAAAGNSPVWSTNSTRQFWACTSSRTAFTLAADGSGSIPSGSTTFGGCGNSVWGTATVAQTSDWPLQVQLAPSGTGATVTLAVSVPRGGLLWSVGTCRVQLSGTLSLSRTYAVALPITVATSDLFSASGSFTADSVSGCSPAMAVAGLGFAFTGSYGFSRGFTISG